MELEENFVKTKIHRNCRNFFKRMYDTPVDIERGFLDELKQFGTLEINEFSKIIAISKDTYIIKGQDGLEIRGVVDDRSILLVIPKNRKDSYETFELLLNNYVKSKKEETK